MANKIPTAVSEYFSKIGRKGGRKRKLTPEQARAMGQASAAKRWGPKPETK